MTEWASLIPGLKARRFDVVVPMFILPNRCREVAFSNPISKTGAAMLVKNGNPKQIQSYEDAAKNKGVIVAVMSGAAEQGCARKAGVPDDRILPLQDPRVLLSAVKSGRADVPLFRQDQPSPWPKKAAATWRRRSRSTRPPGAISYSSPPFRKQDEALLKAFNKALSEFVGSAEHKAINATIGRGDEVLAGNVTSEELCKRD
ncbi:transporter substrate-binding domain-containing protein [Bradyrhizobium sp. DASA03005]|uniref:transporter substrate-binding domain-containing protein n=1 Tax=Bradyrhizobium sp. SPXBL-02 TaxID=3395912 RepID=UPI003F719D72